jgi:hypothetical protein
MDMQHGQGAWTTQTQTELVLDGLVWGKMLKEPPVSNKTYKYPVK